MRSTLSFSRVFPVAVGGSLLGSLLTLSLGCGGLADGGPATAQPLPGDRPAIDSAQAAGEVATTAPRLGDIVREAAARFQVPADLLTAIARVETNFFFVPGMEGDAFEGQPAYGVMALRGERLTRGAELSGQPLSRVQTQPRENVWAAAALLRAAADAEGQALAVSPAGPIAGWAPAIARYSGLPTDDARAEYTRDVYVTLRNGLSDEVNRRHDLRLSPRGDVPDALLSTPQAGTDIQTAYYSGATWKPAPDSNFTNGRSASVELLVIHTCAGAWSGCWGWLTTPYPTNPNKTSAHYVVKEDGASIYALVDETDTAHHVGKPWMGRPTNSRSVGIEHAGFSYQGSNKWLPGQITASQRLACDIVKRQRIIQDRDHIIGHYQPDPVNRATDPGTDFPWADYMKSINTCVGGGGGGGGGIIVDSNQANNGPKARMVTPSTNWTSSSNVSGYWGSGYYVAPTGPVSDAAMFEFNLDAAATKEVFAWWTAASDRSTTTPFVIFDADGNRLATVNKNQQVDGGKWVSLGRYAFTAGWNQVAVSRWTTSGFQVVADAIRVE